jgi:hypothetical protein
VQTVKLKSAAVILKWELASTIQEWLKRGSVNLGLKTVGRSA